jgi:Tfp pilus assembly protein PilF
MYERALRGQEKELGPEYTSTLDTINNLGVLYVDQGKLGLAKQMHKRALRAQKKALGPEYILTLEAFSNLGILYTH